MAKDKSSNDAESTGTVKRTELPAGFTVKSQETEVGGAKYTAYFPQATSLSAVLDAYRAEQPDKDPEEILLGIWNAGNRQGAMQSPKAAVRKVLEEHGEESAEFAAAVKDAQEQGRLFIQGAPRDGGATGARHASGLTTKQRKELGDKVAMEFATTGAPPSAERYAAILEELGIDAAQLGV